MCGPPGPQVGDRLHQHVGQHGQAGRGQSRRPSPPKGVEAVALQPADADISHLARDLVDATALVIGSPTVLGGPHPSVAHAITLVRALRPRLRLAAAFGSYGWGGGAVKVVGDAAKATGLEVLGALEIKGRPSADLERARDLGRKVAQAVKAATA